MDFNAFSTENNDFCIQNAMRTLRKIDSYIYSKILVLTIIDKSNKSRNSPALNCYLFEPIFGFCDLVSTGKFCLICSVMILLTSRDIVSTVLWSTLWFGLS